MKTNSFFSNSGNLFLRKISLVLFISCLFVSCSSDEEEEELRSSEKRKLVTIGDSLTDHLGWQPSVVNSLSLSWSMEETRYGVNGYPRMGFGGTSIKAFYNSKETNPESPSYKGNSIYTRGKMAHYYSPDIITILNTGNEGIANGTINDNPYFGGEEPSGSNHPEITSYSCYKGLIETLLNKCVGVKIYILTPPQPRMNFNLFESVDDAYDFMMKRRYQQVLMAREIAELYGLPLIDLWKDSGITMFNADQYFPEPKPKNTWETHPNEAGYARIADLVVKTFEINNYLK
ncbi:MAG: SGNH/GDSL hydrolase family protein [Bacteroidales bacterium]|nr:SGNH/GDSL hydrolase family protein [Bacteroidales bacterium]